jgi:hypothetical protein
MPAELFRSPKAIRMAFKPLKAADQPDQIAEVFRHGPPSWLCPFIQ